MKLTVFGANGRVGEHVVRQALDKGDRVTAVVRASSTFSLTHANFDLCRVRDLSDVERMAEALRGSDAAISGVGPRRRKDGNVASTATRGILAALQKAGVKRFVAVSAAPVAPPAVGDSFVNRALLFPFITRFLRETYADLALMESEIAHSGLDWTVVRPPRLVDKPVSGVYRTVPGANVPRGVTVSRADVAHFMLACLDDRETIGQAIGQAY